MNRRDDDHIKTHEIFAYLKKGYEAQDVRNPYLYVRLEDDGRYTLYTLDGRTSFRPEEYVGHRWSIKYVELEMF